MSVTTSSRRRVAGILTPVALLLVLAATVTPFFLRDVPYATAAYPYVYSAGALLLLLCRLFDGRKAADLRLRRLYRLEVWEAIIFCVAAAFLFMPGAEMRDWIAFTLAGAALQCYTSIVIPSREAKVNE